MGPLHPRTHHGPPSAWTHASFFRRLVAELHPAANWRLGELWLGGIEPLGIIHGLVAERDPMLRNVAGVYATSWLTGPARWADIDARPDAARWSIAFSHLTFSVVC